MDLFGATLNWPFYFGLINGSKWPENCQNDKISRQGVYQGVFNYYVGKNKKKLRSLVSFGD